MRFKRLNRLSGTRADLDEIGDELCLEGAELHGPSWAIVRFGVHCILFSMSRTLVLQFRVDCLPGKLSKSIGEPGRTAVPLAALAHGVLGKEVSYVA